MEPTDSSLESDQRLETGSQLDSERLRAWHHLYQNRLTAFVLGLTRNRALTEEVVQSTFAKALRCGGDVQAGSEKAWLFQVAFNEAMSSRRQDLLKDRKLKTLTQRGHREDQHESRPEAVFLREELIGNVRQALDELPSEQQVIMRQRIYEERTFQEIADRLEIPLGTVLTRMRLALKKLQTILRNHHE